MTQESQSEDAGTARTSHAETSPLLTSSEISNTVEPNIVHSSSNSKRKVLTKSAQDYVDGISAHAQLPFGQSLYHGRHYSGLAKYLSSINTSDNFKQESAAFAYLHDLHLSEKDPGRIQSFSEVSKFVSACDQKMRTAHPSLILFLNGKGSPEWLRSIGWKCDVDPEFLLRHLEFSLAEKSYLYTHSPLPSSNANTFGFRFPSIGRRQHDGKGSQKDLEALRKTVKKQMKEYAAKLEDHHVSACTSVVRSFALHDLDQFSLEQDVSICVNSFGNGWIAIVWLDSGSDLTEAPEGPWSSPPIRKYDWETRIIPTIMHRRHVALHTRYIERKTKPSSTSPMAQLSSLIPSQYGRFLNQEASIHDPIYALSELFAFCASSEEQFLNMLQTIIQLETDRTLNLESETSSKEEKLSWTLSNLLYNKRILEEHIERLEDFVDLLNHNGRQRWPRATNHKSADRTTSEIAPLLKRFQRLLARAKKLSTNCDRGMDVARNDAIIIEAQRARTQASFVTKLTLLAFLFLPGSSISGIFGMNFVQSENAAWIWLASFLGVYLFSFIVWRWQAYGSLLQL